jgi:hypothetical protein
MNKRFSLATLEALIPRSSTGKGDEQGAEGEPLSGVPGQGSIPHSRLPEAYPVTWFQSA